MNVGVFRHAWINDSSRTLGDLVIHCLGKPLPIWYTSTQKDGQLEETSRLSRKEETMDEKHEWTRDELRSRLNCLTERERVVMTLRFGLLDEQDHTLEEVSKTLGVTRQRISQLEERAWQKLKRPPDETEL
jgi:RNA polymerase sigma factor (sigma-70 family)